MANATPLENLLKRAAAEITDGDYVNLGIGLPSQVIHYVDDAIQPFFHSENGVLGAWKQAERSNMNPMLIDAGGSYISTVSGCSFFDSATSFAMVRRGRLDICMLGAFEVDEAGDVANWKIPNKFSPGIGGAMELAQKAKRLIVLMTHLDKAGNSKVKQLCELPVTATQCVNLIITDKAVMEMTDNGLFVTDIAQNTTPEQLIACTNASLNFADNLKMY